ncbi:MAG TPA: phosphoadenosine phosphosulfate reductase family protein [Solirubrobacterales bacterium]|nr:phosphoadenosine phosphosulfate reductase family protein [Solirubrobacterales bacterium]
MRGYGREWTVVAVAELSLAHLQRTSDALVSTAKRRWNPIKIFCLFSGGSDSAVLAHRCRDYYDELLYIDTGTAVPTSREPAIVGVEDHVRAFAKLLGKPLAIKRSGDAYRTMVLGDETWWRRFRAARHERPALTIEAMIAEDSASGKVSSKVYGNPPFGFPGKGHHAKAYSRLKERRLEEALRETKAGHPRTSAVLFLSGIRRTESRRRAKREPLTQRGSAKFCNPLIEWSALDVAAYRNHFDLPVSEVAALLHRSGECNCGAFAKAEEERSLMRTFWPDWWAETIEALEAEAEALGIRWCRWGGYDLEGNQAAGSGQPGLLCSNCHLRDPGGQQDDAVAAAGGQDG